MSNSYSDNVRFEDLIKSIKVIGKCLDQVNINLQTLNKTIDDSITTLAEVLEVTNDKLDKLVRK